MLDAKRKQDETVFFREGEQARQQGMNRYDVGQLKAGRDWKMKADWGKLLQEILYTIEDQILWSETQRVVYFVELTVPWEDAKEMGGKSLDIQY